MSSCKSIYEKSPTETLIAGYTMYGRLQDYWKKNGKPFLNRTLLYERGVRTQISLRNKRSYSIEQVPAFGQFYQNLYDESKPFSIRVVFEGISDQSGKGGNVDLGVRLIRITEPGELKDEPTDENKNGRQPLNRTVTVPRNSSNMEPDSVTVPMTQLAKKTGSSARDYLLFSCDLPSLMRDSSRQKVDWFGWIEIGSGGVSQYKSGCETSIKMKFMNRTADNHRDSSELLKSLLENEDSPPYEKPPTLDIRLDKYQLPLPQCVSGCTQSLSRPNQRFANHEARAISRAIRISYSFDFQQNGQPSDEAPKPTSPTDKTSCPLCRERYGDAYSLLQHFRCCHLRCRFIAKDKPDHLLVEIKPIQFYDARPETRFPFQRLSKRKSFSGGVTKFYKEIFFCRPLNKRYSKLGHKMLPRNLDEFKVLSPLDADYEFGKMREETLRYHNRQYYHSHSGQALTLDELDEVSEDEMDPKWLKRSVERRIDEVRNFSDAEKSFMKMWNLHMLKNKFYANKQMEAACQSLLAKQGRRIVAENLETVFSAHLANLQSNGLLSPDQRSDLNKRLNAFKM